MKKSEKMLLKNYDFAEIYQNQLKLPQYNHHSPKTATSKNHKRLPNITIKSTEKFQNVNLAKDQAEQANNNMKTLQVRINSLKKQRQKNSKEIIWAKQKIQFMRTIKERCESDTKKKQEVSFLYIKYHHNKQLENAYLKHKVSEFKHNLKNDHKQAINNLTKRRHEHSQMMRTQNKLNKTYIQEINDMILEKNNVKALQIKQMKKQLKNLKKNYLEENKARVKEIYQGYMHNYDKIKSRAHSRIKQLSQEQQHQLEQLKMSETSKLKEFKNLEEIVNPQSKFTKSVYKQMFKKIFTSNNKDQDKLKEIKD